MEFGGFPNSRSGPGMVLFFRKKRISDAYLRIGRVKVK